MRWRSLVIIAFTLLLGCSRIAQPPPPDLRPEVRIRLPILKQEDLVYLMYTDSQKSDGYMAPDQHPAAVEQLLLTLSRAPETGRPPINAMPKAMVNVRLKDGTWLHLGHFGGTLVNVHADGQAAALEIPGLPEAIKQLATLPPGARLGEPVTGLPEPVVLLTGHEADEFRTAERNTEPATPNLSDFGLGFRGALSPDGRRFAFTFGVSDGHGLWVLDVDSGRYRYLQFFAGIRSLNWLSPDRLIFEWDQGVGCAALDSELPLIRPLDLPGEEHRFVLGVESPWITYRTTRGAETVVQKIRVDGPGGCV